MGERFRRLFGEITGARRRQVDRRAANDFDLRRGGDGPLSHVTCRISYVIDVVVCHMSYVIVISHMSFVCEAVAANVSERSVTVIILYCCFIAVL